MKRPHPSDTDPRLLQLAPLDNVLTALEPLEPGERIRIRGRTCSLSTRIPFGHKVAAAAIPRGGKVLKYGVPIGAATRAIAPGAHVHTHNLRSDYLPTVLREDQGLYFNRRPASLPRRVSRADIAPAPAEAQPRRRPALPRLPSTARLANRRWEGYLRSDGRKGIRNVLVVVYLVECAHHVAREICQPFRDRGVHLIGFGGCYPNAYALRMLQQLCTHPNVGGALLVSLGCESFNRAALAATVEASGRPVHTLVIQEAGGTRPSVQAGRAWIRRTLRILRRVPRVPMRVSDLVVGTICGGSDTTSGITANPAVGRAFDLLVRHRARAIFEETGELIGCEGIMARRASRAELAPELIASVTKAARHYATLGHGSFAPGNAEGGLTTLEEKSMGAYSKSGSSRIEGLLKPGDLPPQPGLYLLDVVPDGEVRFGFANINDTAEIAELMACGSHLILFTTGRGSVVGSAIAPVLKVCANPETYRRMPEDMDVNAGRILAGQDSLDGVGAEILDRVLATAEGRPTASEYLGHQEFVLTYKTFEPTGPACLPAS